MKNKNRLERVVKAYYGNSLTYELKRDLTDVEVVDILMLIVDYNNGNVLMYNKLSKDLAVDFVGWNNPEYFDLIIC